MLEQALGTPGIKTGRAATPREVLQTDHGKALVPSHLIIDGAESRDLGNTSLTHYLRAGLLMGKITSSSKLAPAIIGVCSAYDGGTTLTVSAAIATEIVRRIGATGTLKLTGPDEAGGTTRSMTITYSAVNTSTGAITVTAVSVDTVWTLTPQSGVDGGTFKLRVTTPDGLYEDTAAITFNATGATFEAAIDAALEAVTLFPADAATVSSVDTTGISTITIIDDVGAVRLDLIEDKLTDGSTFEGESQLARTTAGVDGNFIAGSFVGASDGSHEPITVITDRYGIRVTDEDANDIDVPLAEVLAGGMLNTSKIVDYPTDTSLIAWVKTELRSVGIGYAFSDDF